VIGAQSQICVNLRPSAVKSFPVFLRFLCLFAAIPICLPFAPLRLCVSFFLILLVAGRQGLTEAVTGAASGVPGSVLTDN
jgi:hypothetical protein